MSDHEQAGDDQEGFTLPARRVPVPTSISQKAQAALASVGPVGPGLPPLEDKAAWRTFVSDGNTRLASMLRSLAEGLDVALDQRELGGVPVYVADPGAIAANNRSKARIFFHGGGLVMGGGESAGLLGQIEASRYASRVYAVDFGNPPDAPYPAAVSDGVTVYRTLLEQYDAEDLVITGASGGGNLAIAVPIAARDEGLPLPRAVGLFTPQADLTESGDTFQTLRGVDPSLSDLSTFNRLYAAGCELSDPVVSPLFADFGKGFSPTFLQSGTRDVFLSNTVRLHRRLRSAGIYAELHVGEAMPHGGFGMGLAEVPENTEMWEEFRRFLVAQAGWSPETLDQ